MDDNLSINDILLMESEIAISWSDTTHSYLSYKKLREKCPCAFCSGEKDVFGNIYKGSLKKLDDISYQVNKFEKVGHYAIRIFWGDNHADGLYTFEYLKKLGKIEENKA